MERKKEMLLYDKGTENVIIGRRGSNKKKGRRMKGME